MHGGFPQLTLEQQSAFARQRLRLKSLPSNSISDASIEVPVAYQILGNASKLCEGCENASPISLDVSNANALDAEVEKVDMVGLAI